MASAHNTCPNRQYEGAIPSLDSDQTASIHQLAPTATNAGEQQAPIVRRLPRIPIPLLDPCVRYDRVLRIIGHHILPHREISRQSPYKAIVAVEWTALAPSPLRLPHDQFAHPLLREPRLTATSGRGVHHVGTQWICNHVSLPVVGYLIMLQMQQSAIWVLEHWAPLAPRRYFP